MIIVKFLAKYAAHRTLANIKLDTVMKSKRVLETKSVATMNVVQNVLLGKTNVALHNTVMKIRAHVLQSLNAELEQIVNSVKMASTAYQGHADVK